MIGTLTAFAITYWFYKTAEKNGKDPISSAAVGFFAFLIPCIVWTFAITPGLNDKFEHNPATFLGLIANYAYIVVGVSCAAWVKYKHFKTANK